MLNTKIILSEKRDKNVEYKNMEKLDFFSPI